MLDAEDRQTLALWFLRGAAVVVGVLVASVTLGAAVRLFSTVAGW